MSSPNSIFQSYSVLQRISLPSYTLRPADDIEKENKPFCGYDTIGGVLSYTNYVWNASGSLLTLCNSKSGAKVAAWNFGTVIKSSTAIISCVVELHRGSGKLPLLIVGLQCDTHGQVCVFNISRSRVLRCIEINERVTSLSVVDAEYEVSSFAKYFRAFDGVVAVGTSGGNVYLVDINRLACEEVLESEVNVRDEINPCQLEIVLPDEDLLENSYSNAKHLSILLNGEENEVECFVLRGPKNDVRIFVNKEEVEVSALQYCSQLGSLLVGFNFGAWQLWDLINMKLIYTSPVYEENIPVSHFGIQEPCDDPRGFCYIWTVYSHTEPDQPGYSLAVLYSLNYESKEYIEGYGMLYKNLTSCSVRFQMDVTNCQHESEKSSTPIRVQCVKLQTINKTISRNYFGDNQDETVKVCSIVWNVWNTSLPKKCRTYLSLFDLNQWYKEQMPASLNSKDCETYLSKVCLTNILKSSDNQPILDVRINPDTLNQFMGSQRLEEHYHPSSLAFQMIALEKTHVNIIDNQGNQRALMSSLESLGPAVLLKPTELFLMSIDLGLTPLFVDVPNKISTTLDFQREFLLSIAVEQKLLGWLCKCVSTWSSGVYEQSGCSLNFLLLWGWQRAQVLKENADKLCVILFDYSGLRLDANTHNLLTHCLTQLKNISTLFKFVVRKFLGFVLNPDAIKDQCESIETASTHLEVVDWLLNIGLLPECSESSYPRVDEFGRINAPYPIKSLNKYYEERRCELKALAYKQFSSNDNLLFIDNIMEYEFGGYSLQNQWDAVSKCTGYPPQSLQALMRTYLVENVSLLNKHSVVAYLLLDICGALDQNQYQLTIAHLLKFPAVFHLSLSITKIIQSFWQLDHGDFQAAIDQLLDPMISSNDLKLWHHRVVLKALLAHGQYNFALIYLQVRQPPVTEVNDLCTILSLYVSNNMIDEAFHFQRENQNLDVATTLLRHFFKECDKVGNLKAILFFPLNKEEEEIFMKYLKEVNHPQANELQIYYYTQHSRYVDAMQVYDKTGRIKSGSRGLEGQHVLSDTDNIINKLTSVSDPLSSSIMDQVKKGNLNKRKASNLQPFSVFVHNSEEQIKYKSSVIEAALDKAKETWTQPSLNKTLTKSIIHDDIPFLSTPRAKLLTSRVLTPLIYPKSTTSKEEDGPSPPKRFKPTSRLSMSTLDKKWDSNVTCKTLSVRLNTPIVKRKPSRSIENKTTLINVETPPSILKSQIYKIAVSSEGEDSNQSNDAIKDIHNSFNIGRNTRSTSNTNLSLTPRRSLLGSSRPAVRFSFSKPPSESSLTSNSSDPDFEIIQENALVHSSLEGEDVEQKNASMESHEVEDFVSGGTDKDLIKTKESLKSNVTSESTKRESSFGVISEPPKTPRSRRSYRELREVSVRSSPRLHKLKQTETQPKVDLTKIESTTSNETKDNISISTSLSEAPRSRKSYRDTLHNESEPSSSKEMLPHLRTKLQGRRSLTRKVLEYNTFNRMTEIKNTIISTLKITKNESMMEESSEDISVTENMTETVMKDNHGIEDSGQKITEQMPEEQATIGVETNEELIAKEDEVEPPPSDVTTVEERENYFKEIASTPLTDATNYPPIEERRNSSEEIVQNVSGEEQKNISEESTTKEKNLLTSTTNPPAEEIKNSSEDTDKIDVNIYDSSEDDDYEAVDPKLSVLDTSNDLTLNEAICAVDDNVLEIETNSNYLADSGEVFGDKSDVLIVLDDNISENVVSDEYNKSVDEIGIGLPENRPSTEGSSKQSSVSSDVEVIELSSSSDEEDLDRSTSIDGDLTSESESSVNPTDSEESANSNILYNEYSVNSKDIVTQSFPVDDVGGRKERDDSESVIVEEIQENVEVETSEQMVDLEPIYEEDEEIQSKMDSNVDQQKKVSSGVELIDSDKNVAEEPTEAVDTKIVEEECLFVLDDLEEEKAATKTKSFDSKIIQDNKPEKDYDKVESIKVVEEEKSPTRMESIDSKSNRDNKPQEIESTKVVEKEDVFSINEEEEKPVTEMESIDSNSNQDDIQGDSVKVENTKIVEKEERFSVIEEENVVTKMESIDSKSDQDNKPQEDCDKVKITKIVKGEECFSMVDEEEKAITEMESIDSKSNQDNNLQEDSVKVENAVTKIESIDTKGKNVEGEKCASETDNVNIKSNILVESSNNTSPFTISDKYIFDDESINITPNREMNDTFDFNSKSNKLFMASTPSQSLRIFEENASYETDILDRTPDASTSNWLCQSDILSTPMDQRKTIYYTDKSDYLNDTAQQSSNASKIILDDIFASKHVTPARRSQRISSLHTPNISQTSDLRKYTLRKRSLSTSHANPSIDPIKLKQSLSKLTEKQKPSKRKRSSSSNASGLALSRSKRGASVDVELLSNKNKSVQEPPTDTLSVPIRRKRGISVDVDLLSDKNKSTVKETGAKTQLSISLRSRRGASADVELLSEKNKTAITDVPAEENVSKTTKKTAVKKSKSAIVSYGTTATTYSSSRRLTRRQADLLKKKLGTDSLELKETDDEKSNDSDDDHSPTRGPDLSTIDTIKLLDKKSFDGDPDPDEELINKSPVSSLPESPVGSKLRSKSSTPCSETSPSPSETNRTKAKRRLVDADGISKTRQKSKTSQLQPKSTDVPKKMRKTRLKSKDTDVSDTSTISQAHSVLEVKKPARITRRTRSMTEETEPILRRSERNALSKSQLPIIDEERSVTTEHEQRTSRKKK